uniref:IQ domain-containing protein IQM1-like n=1 Tax=Nelumbo nucifera TaxID=4432 RepID=A0A822ZDW8_NELNU|nr:TPA_asm: hypothetical protein HUJ06_002614 [Nelumbo nucifera]
MGLSLSLLLSAWKEILKIRMLGYAADNVKTVTVRSINFDGKDGEMTLRTVSFKKEDTEAVLKSDGSDKVIIEEPISFKNSVPPKLKLETTVSFKDLVLDSKSLSSSTWKSKDDNSVNASTPISSLPDPVILFSPRPVSELDAAAVKLQKVYKSYRTRRNLADCAVVVEELWKTETAVSRWARARTRAAKVGKGLSKDEKAQKLALQHWLEAIDPRHRYGHNLHFYYDVWFDSESTQPFFYWLDVGDGKEINLERCARTDLQRQCIKYLGPKEREAYEVIVDSGKLVYKQNGTLVDTIEGSKWIFVLSTSRALYVGQKKKGVFQHSSFLAGGATTAAGRLVAHNGVLEAIWPYSGHYHPTEENFKEFISFLEENQVDLSNVKRCAIDDDCPSFKLNQEESNSKSAEHPTATVVVSADKKTSGENVSGTANTEEDSKKEMSADRMGQAVFDVANRLSRKWTTGAGPRIGCVREYPTELQFRALEKVNLSPRVTPGPIGNYPIPSPRPSPKVRLSPRIAYMGLPSPRVSVPVAN